jgi:hypothetical protein
MDVVVLEPGPIRHAHLHRFDDPDIETGLEHGGHSAEDATYRLIEINVSDLEDAQNFPFDWQPTHTIERLRAGEVLPPIVVVQTNRGRGLGIIDGLNRAYAHWLEGHRRIRAYELLVGGHC